MRLHVLAWPAKWAWGVKQENNLFLAQNFREAGFAPAFFVHYFRLHLPVGLIGLTH